MAPSPNPAPSTDFDRLAAILEELRRQHDPRRSAAEQAEYLAMAEKYPGQFVAFLDHWDGEKLTREVIAASAALADVHRGLRAFPEYEAKRREIAMAQTRDPDDDAINVPSVWFEDEMATDQVIGEVQPIIVIDRAHVRGAASS